MSQGNGHRHIILENDPAIVAMPLPFNVALMKINIRRNLLHLVHLRLKGNWQQQRHEYHFHGAIIRKTGGCVKWTIVVSSPCPH